MAKFKYTGSDERHFLLPGRAITVQPGDVVEADECPDPYWFEAATAEKPAKDKE